MKQHPPLLAALNNEVIAVDGARSSWFESCLNAVANHPRSEELMDRASSTSEDEGFWPPADDWRAAYRPYIVKAGILHIPVMGVLLNRFSFQLGHFATGYTYIERALRRGLEDDEVMGIAFIHDSPGGEVSGCFELAEKIFQARGEKPMKAFASDRMYSASYALASASDRISTVRTSGVGSIGVVTLHLDFSEALNMEGVKATFIKAGEFKTDGNHLEPLSKHAKQRIQLRIDSTMDIFVQAVARNRGLSESAIRATEAEAFTAQEALEIGLADQIENFEDAMMAFTEDCSSGSGEDHMTKTTDQPQAITQAQLDEAVAKASTDAKAAGVAEGTRDERARITAIVGCEAAKGKGEQALALALNSNMDVAAIEKVLPSLKADAAPAPVKGEKKPDALKQVFDAAMQHENPEVGAGGGDNREEANADEVAAQSILGAFRGATGRTKAAA